MAADRTDRSAPTPIAGWDRPTRWLLGGAGPVAFVVVVAAVAVVRSGVSVGNAGIHGLAFARTFPTPAGEFASWGVIGPAVAAALGLTSDGGWVLLQWASLSLAVVVTGALLYRRLPSTAGWRAGVIWASLSPMVAVQLHHLRSYDIWMLLGGSLVALGSGAPTAVLAGLLLGLSNAEAGVVGVVCTALVLVAARRSDLIESEAVGHLLRRLGVVALALVVARAGVALWFRAAGHRIEDRADLFVPNLRLAVRGQLSVGTYGVFSWHGMAWVVVGALLWRCRSDRRALALASLGLVAAAAAVTFVTMDGTRVFVTITWSAFLTALVALLRDELVPGRVERPLLRTAVPALAVGLLVPSIVTTPWGEVFMPWTYVAERLLR